MYKEDIQLESKPVIPEKLETTWNYDLELKFDSNIKRRHYWIWCNESGVGKTQFGVKLQSYSGVAVIQWQKGYWNSTGCLTAETKLLLIDELAPETAPPSPELNKLCDGLTPINIKMAPSVTTNKDVVVIVLSNYHWSQIYQDPTGIELKTKVARFNGLGLRFNEEANKYII